MKLKNKYFFGLQFFADEGGEGDEGNGEGEGGTEKHLTQEQVNEIVQKRLAKEQAKWEKKLADEKAEAKRLAEMDAEQRKQAEFDKRLKELEAKEAELKLQESKLETAKVLKEHGLHEGFVDFVIGADNDATLERINNLEKIFKAAVKEAVDAKLPSNTPPAGGNPNGNKDMTKEEFKKLPLSKQNELYVKDPEKYKQLF